MYCNTEHSNSKSNPGSQQKERNIGAQLKLNNVQTDNVPDKDGNEN